MARKKKRPLTKANVTTPDSKEKANERIDFHRRTINRECQKRIDELVETGERLIQLNKQTELELLATIPANMGNMKLGEFFEAGYMLDYQYTSVSGKFVALSPLHFEIRDEAAQPKAATQTKSARHTGVLRPQNTAVYSTPAHRTNPVSNGMLITPKVTLQPKRGHIVTYSETGSPYMCNMATGKFVKVVEEGPPTVTRSTRTTRRNP